MMAVNGIGSILGDIKLYRPKIKLKQGIAKQDFKASPHNWAFMKKRCR